MKAVFFFLDLCISIIHFCTHICHCPLCFTVLRTVIEKLQQLPRQQDFLHLFTCGQPQGEISAGPRFEEQNPVFGVLCGPLACLVVVIQDDQLHRPAEREREELRERRSCLACPKEHRLLNKAGEYTPTPDFRLRVPQQLHLVSC